jgi:flavorubredoxin
VLTASSSNDLLNRSAASAVRLAGETYRLGGFVELDGQVSWAPRLPGRYQPINCYLVDKKEGAVLIDTGLAAHQQIVLRQLNETFDPRRPISLFLTRPELECAGNVGAVHKALTLKEIVAVAVNPFDAYEEGVEGVVPVRMLPLAIVRSIPIGEPPSLCVVPTIIRILSTFWVFDQETKTLFSSDWFGHTSVSSPSDSVVISSPANDSTTYQSARAHVLAKYWWLPLATTKAMIGFLEGLFDQHDVERIAPTHGCVLESRPVVRNHRDMMLRLLQEVGK